MNESVKVVNEINNILNLYRDMMQNGEFNSEDREIVESDLKEKRGQLNDVLKELHETGASSEEIDLVNNSIEEATNLLGNVLDTNSNFSSKSDYENEGFSHDDEFTTEDNQNYEAEEEVLDDTEYEETEVENETVEELDDTEYEEELNGDEYGEAEEIFEEIENNDEPVEEIYDDYVDEELDSGEEEYSFDSYQIEIPEEPSQEMIEEATGIIAGRGNLTLQAAILKGEQSANLVMDKINSSEGRTTERPQKVAEKVSHDYFQDRDER